MSRVVAAERARVAMEALQMAYSAKDPGSQPSPSSNTSTTCQLAKSVSPACVCEAIPTTSLTLTPNLFGGQPSHDTFSPPLSSFLSISHIIHSTLFHRDGDWNSHAPAKMTGPLLAHIYAGTRPSTTRVPSLDASTRQGMKLTDLLKSSIAVSWPNVQCRTQYPRPRCCRTAIEAPIRRSVMLMPSRPCRACLSHLPLLDLHRPKASTSCLRLERMQPY